MMASSTIIPRTITNANRVFPLRLNPNMFIKIKVIKNDMGIPKEAKPAFALPRKK
jgi:hypothetical protein